MGGQLLESIAVPRLDIPPPANWEEFEDLCLELWRLIWDDPKARKHGRRGQPQAGVDIYGQPKGGPRWEGVQCKLKSQILGKRLTQKEIEEEIVKAKTFTPDLAAYTLATTAPRDIDVEALVREISDAQHTAGSFRVNVVFWDDILEEMERVEEDHPGLLIRYHRAWKRLEYPAHPARPLMSQHYAGRNVVGVVDQLVREYNSFFVGREDVRTQLETFLKDNSSGVLILTGSAGFGKSAVMANWLSTLQADDYFVAYHFFSYRYPLTQSLNNTYTSLLRQLYTYYRISDDLPSSDRLLGTLYGLLEDHVGNVSQPLIIMLDGLDEAEQLLPRETFPGTLPCGVSLIASARVSQSEEHECLRGWTDGAFILHIDRLPLPAVTEWLKQIGDGELRESAEDDAFLAAVEEMAEGFPLYLSHLVEELHGVARQGGNAQNILAKTPKGFEGYVARQLQSLERLNLSEKLWKLLALLATAKGPLLLQEIKVLTRMRDRDIRQLDQRWEVTRWLHVYANQGVRSYAFAHQRIAETFSSILADEAEDATSTLMTWCANWEDHQSLYVLRYYSEHLRDQREYGTLYSLARNLAFARAQQINLPDEPDMPLRTASLALACAADTDNASSIAEFLLLHAQRAEQARQHSPLKILREEGSESAWKRADLFEPERRVLWCLLLVWELMGNGRLDDARAFLGRLIEESQPRLSESGHPSPWAMCAALLLTHVPEVNKNALEPLQAQILGDDTTRTTLCLSLANRALFSEALETTKRIEDMGRRVSVLNDVANIAADAGERTTAREILDTSLQRARSIGDASSRAFAIGDVTRTLAAVGDIDTAKVAAQTIEDSYSRALALSEIAKAEVEAGMSEGAAKTFLTATEVAATVSGSPARALRYIAGTQARVKEIAAALETVKKIESDWLHSREEALTDISMAYANAGDLAAATKLALSIEDAKWRSSAQVEIAEAQARTGNRRGGRKTLAAALRTAHLIEDRAQRTRALIGIAEAQARIGDREAAGEIFSVALSAIQGMRQAKDGDAYLRDIALTDLAKAQANSDIGIAAAKETAQCIGGDTDHRLAWALYEIVKVQIEVGRIAAALDTASSIEFLAPRAEAFICVARAQDEAGDGQAARDTLSIMLQKSQRIDHQEERSFALREAARALAKTEDKDAAREAFGAAISTAQQIADTGWCANSLRGIAKSQADVGEFSAALETMKLIKGHRWEDDYWCASALRELARTKAATGEVVEAMALVQRFEVNYWRAIALSDIARIQAEVGEPSSARRLLTSAIKTAKAIESDTPHRCAEALREIARVQAAVGERSTAGKTIWAAIETAKKMEGYWCGHELIEAVKILAEMGDFKGALKAAQSINNDVWRSDALREVAVAQLEAGKETTRNTFLMALETARRIEGEWSRDLALGRLAKAYSKAKDIAGAMTAVKEISNSFRRALIFSEIAAAQANLGEMAGARHTANIALDMSTRLQSGLSRTEVLREVARAQAAGGEMDEARKTFSAAVKMARRIEILPSPHPLVEIARAQVEVGLGTEVSRLAVAIPTNRSKYLPEVAEVLAEAGERESFKQFLLPCAYSVGSAYRICGFMIRLYPEQASEVAEVLKQGDR